MTLTLIIAGITAISMTISVIVKPYINLKKLHIGLYCIIALAGEFLMLITGALPLNVAIKGIMENSAVNPLKILTLFISMTLISVFLDDAGFFEYVAHKIFKVSKNGGVKLFLTMYLIVSVLTVFTSNDIIVLTFTPPICLFAKRAKISPIPYLIGEFVAANTWSMALIIGNPTNIYLATGAGISFIEYLSVMLLPTIVGGITSLCILLLIFRRPLSRKTCIIPYTPMSILEENQTIEIRKIPLIVSLSHLIICIIFLSIAEFLKIEMWIICATCCVSLIIFNFFYSIFKDKTLKHLIKPLEKAPYELIPFVLSMFIIALALDNCGFTKLCSNVLLSGHSTDGFITGFLSAISANLLNNIPMSVLFEKIVSNSSVASVYGAIIGSNIGAFITPVGALAGIMWTKILGEHGVKLSFGKFSLYGTIIALPTILTTSATLLLIL